MKKRNLLKRMITIGLCMAILVGSTGVVFGEQHRGAPYRADVLEVTQGRLEVDLLEGIHYNAGRYVLEVEDSGGFDSAVLGSYQVSYTLTEIPEEHPAPPAVEPLCAHRAAH